MLPLMLCAVVPSVCIAAMLHTHDCKLASIVARL
jgi:hypothetical protein